MYTNAQQVSDAYFNINEKQRLRLVKHLILSQVWFPLLTSIFFLPYVKLYSYKKLQVEYITIVMADPYRFEFIGDCCLYFCSGSILSQI